jgi:sialate O-acetylesterase
MIKIKLISALLCNAVLASTLLAEIKTPAVIGNNMVLQRNHKNPIWGWGNPGETVKLTISSQSHETKTDKKGYWKITLNPMKASTAPKTMTIQGSSTLKYGNILIGEVWLCSGQSNMGWSVGQSDDKDLESMSAKFPNLRLISIPQIGTQGTAK